MKVHINSKVTQYLKIRFINGNCFKYSQQCRNGIFEKMVGQQRYTNQLYGSPLDIIHIEAWGSPNTNNKRLLQPCYSLDFKKQQNSSKYITKINL